MSSMQWTEEESRYLKAIFSWQDRLEKERNGGGRTRTTAKASAGEFRILLIGAKGVGKTALLRRFCDGSFYDKPDPSDSRFERGGRRTIEIDGQMYTVDVLELLSQDMGTAHLNGSEKPEPATMMLDQALAITEAAIVMYDVCDLTSFQQAKKLYERLQLHKQQLSSESHPNNEQPRKPKSSSFRNQKRRQSNATTSGLTPKTRRPFALLLVGNKSDMENNERHVSKENGAITVAMPPGLLAHSTHNVLVRKRPASATPAATAGTANAGKRTSGPTDTSSTKVSTTSGSFIETSAKTGDKVNEVFVSIGRDILQQRKKLQQEAQETLAAAGRGSTSSNALERMRSRASSTTRRRFIGLRTGFPFRRTTVALDTQ